MSNWWLLRLLAHCQRKLLRYLLQGAIKRARGCISFPADLRVITASSGELDLEAAEDDRFTQQLPADPARAIFRRMKAPIIGITLDSEEPGGYSKFPWYAVRQNYAHAVVAAGGVPVMLPHEPSTIGQYLEMIDGLLVTGGNFDVDPALFGAGSRHATVKLKSARTEFEFGITKGAIARDMPVFGICGGQQLLNVVLGGSLIQHIPDEIDGALAHEQPNPRDQAGHAVKVSAGTRLHQIVRMAELPVNSAHHQAVKDLGPGVVVNAIAPDGVIEGLELSQRRFCLGVQWHPEFEISEGDSRLFAAFVAAANQA